MIAVRLLLLVSILVACSLAPGFFFVRRWRWGPLEKLCGSIGLSLLLIYLASFGIYVLELPGYWHWLVTGAALILGLLSGRELLGLLGSRSLRRPLAGFGLLGLWTLLLLGLVRHYGGGGWCGDWYEHYHRMVFFLDHLPVGTVIYGGYQFPARPPMMNLLAAHFAAQVGRDFELFQVTFAFLNLLIFLPCCLVARALVKRSSRKVMLFAGLMALCPMLAENVTYTWTKLFSGFYVLLATWLYVVGVRKKDSLRTVAAFGFLATGVLVHYSAGPFVLFFALHYLVTALRGLKARWRELALSVLVAAALLSTWFGWSMATYGVQTTFGSNTAVLAAQRTRGSNLARIGRNIFCTIVPHPLRGAGMGFLRQHSRIGYFRDYVFLIYQTSFPMAMGVVGGLVITYLFCAAAARYRSAANRKMLRFWLAYTIFCSVVGMAVIGERDLFGVAHICLMPIAFMGLALLAGSLARLPRVVRWLVVVGCAVDFALGILLQFRLENATFRVWTEGGRKLAAPGEGGQLLSQVAIGNWTVKLDYGLRFLGDHLPAWSTHIQAVLLAGFALVAWRLIREALLPKAGGPAATGYASRSPRGTTGDSDASRRARRSGSGRPGGRTKGRGPARRARR